MSLAFIPIYIKYLGVESFGLIGLFIVLQTGIGLLDIGMRSALGREMARFTGGAHSAQSIRDLLRSIEVIVFGIAVFIASGIALSANWIATLWLQVKSLPVDVITKAFMLMGLVTAIRFMKNVYHSCIIGLQRHVFYSVFNSAIATLRGLGAVGVLVWISASIEAFFIWQGLVSIISLIIFMVLTYASLLPAERAGKFSLVALRGIWKFSGGSVGITLLAGTAAAGFLLLLWSAEKNILNDTVLLILAGSITIVATMLSAQYTRQHINYLWQSYWIKIKTKNNYDF
jgi:hypothetical protein